MVKQIYTLSMQLLLVLGKDKHVVCVNEIIFQERFFNLALLVSILECLIPPPQPFFSQKRSYRPAGREWNSMLAQNHILRQFRWQSLRASETSGERKSSIPRQMVFGVTESSNFDYTSKNEIANSCFEACELSLSLSLYGLRSLA